MSQLSKQLPQPPSCAIIRGMSASRLDESALRPAEHLLVWAFAISLAMHVLIYGGFLVGHRLGWWKRDMMPAWLKSTKQTLAEIKKNQPQPVMQEPPLLFVEVNPEAATQDAPKNAKYYSSQNAKAANPDATIDTQTPKIDGSQTHIPKTESAPRSRPVPLQPSPPKPPADAQQADADEKPKPKGGPKIGDLAMAKPAPQPGDGQVEDGKGEAQTEVHKRPHTLAEVTDQQTLHGEKMKQDGGVSRRLRISSLDTTATATGAYDAALIRAIQYHWDDLLERREFSRDRSGKVVLEFNLLYNGDITDLRVIESNVGDVLTYVCQRAILDPKPFPPWPTDMRRVIGGDSRDVTFTFYYE
ncbi:MAG: hypothetical protein JWQ04_1196 [Pedosphaera sp.]|nr:hypothetical protein [Pedosphaera sp.]